MATSWQGQIFVFADCEGREYVSPTFPFGVAKAGSFRMYAASGPFLPVTGMTVVGNAVAWLHELKSQGFRFQLAQPFP